MGHYITNRLVGERDRADQPAGRRDGRGLGRLLRHLHDLPGDRRLRHGYFAVGGWTDLTPTFKDNYYFSIRRYPYSADMTRTR